MGGEKCEDTRSGRGLRPCTPIYEWMPGMVLEYLQESG